jgi:hypothetical protein
MIGLLAVSLALASGFSIHDIDEDIFVTPPSLP